MQLNRIGRDWRLKVAVQRLIGLVPGPAAFVINEKIVSRMQRGVAARLDLEARVRKGLDNLALVRTETGFTPLGSRIFELGTGWHGADLLVFYALGAESITTIDHHPHLDLPTVRDLAGRLCREPLRTELALAGAPEERLRLLAEYARTSTSLPDLLPRLGVTFLIRPSRDYGRLPVSPGSVDLFYSESVLQRIPERDLSALFGAMASRYMAPGAAFFHRTDQKDIHAQEHVGASGELWALEYLKFEELFFRTIYSGRLTSQNRLRESDFTALLEKAGLVPDRILSECRSEDVRRMGRLRVASRFADYSMTDLATIATRFVGRRAPGFSVGEEETTASAVG